MMSPSGGAPLALSRIAELLKSSATKAPVIVGIDGPCGSGKSTLAEIIRQAYDCPEVHMDHFFLQPHQRTAERLQETGGNVDYERFTEEVVRPLKARQPFAYQVYDCKVQAMTESIAITPGRLIVVEGSYALHPHFSGLYDLSICLQIDEQEQARRLLLRSGPVLFQRFAEIWIPMENRYFEDLRIVQQADLVVTL
jgi:uridine kinase